MNFVEAMTAAQAGYDTWAAKPHNAKWAKRIYHTPIPNDLLVNIAEAVCAATRPADVITTALKAKAEGWDDFADEMEALQILAKGRALGGDRLIPWAIKTIRALDAQIAEVPITEVVAPNIGRPVPRTFYDFDDQEFRSALRREVATGCRKD